MGQAGQTKRLPQLSRQRHLGAAEHQSGHQTTTLLSCYQLQAISDGPAGIRNWRPGTLQHLELADAQLTPAALTSQSLGRPWQQSMRTR